MTTTINDDFEELSLARCLIPPSGMTTIAPMWRGTEDEVRRRMEDLVTDRLLVLLGKK